MVRWKSFVDESDAGRLPYHIREKMRRTRDVMGADTLHRVGWRCCVGVRIEVKGTKRMAKYGFDELSLWTTHAGAYIAE